MATVYKSMKRRCLRVWCGIRLPQSLSCYPSEEIEATEEHDEDSAEQGNRRRPDDRRALDGTRTAWAAPTLQRCIRLRSIQAKLSPRVGAQVASFDGSISTPLVVYHQRIFRCSERDRSLTLLIRIWIPNDLCSGPSNHPVGRGWPNRVGISV